MIIMNKKDITLVHKTNLTFMLVAGLSEEYIAKHLMSKPITLEELRENFGEEMANGEKKLHQEMAERLIAAARRGNVLAITTWLKARGNWSETHKLENSDKPFIVRVENSLKKQLT
jgi:hypothetical protein